MAVHHYHVTVKGLLRSGETAVDEIYAVDGETPAQASVKAALLVLGDAFGGLEDYGMTSNMALAMGLLGFTNAMEHNAITFDVVLSDECPGALS